MRKTPITTISPPDTFSSKSRFSLRVPPRLVAVRPRAMKIAEKLATNSRLGPSTLRTGALSSSTAETPVTADR